MALPENLMEKHMNDKQRERHEMTKFIQEEIGAMLRAAREDQGMSIEEAARFMHVANEEIVRIERNIGQIPLAMLQKYADILGKKIQLKFLK